MQKMCLSVSCLFCSPPIPRAVKMIQHAKKAIDVVHRSLTAVPQLNSELSILLTSFWVLLKLLAAALFVNLCFWLLFSGKQKETISTVLVDKPLLPLCFKLSIMCPTIGEIWQANGSSLDIWLYLPISSGHPNLPYMRSSAGRVFLRNRKTIITFSQ